MSRNIFQMKINADDISAFLNDLTSYSRKDSILLALFDVVCWQIRLTLLDPNSIHRVGDTAFLEENQYRVIKNVRQAFVAFVYTNINMPSYEHVEEIDRYLLPYNGAFPPPRILMIKELLIEGEEYLVKYLYDRFMKFISEDLLFGEKYERIRNLARKKICHQEQPWFSLPTELFEYFNIQKSDYV